MEEEDAQVIESAVTTPLSYILLTLIPISGRGVVCKSSGEALKGAVAHVVLRRATWGAAGCARPPAHEPGRAQ